MVNPGARERASAGRLMMRLAPSLTASGRVRRAPTRIVVVVTGPNPSFDYYLAPRLGADVPTEVRDITAAPTPGEARAMLAGAFVLFCRHMSGAWLRAVESCEDLIAGVGLFVDDDIDALAADRTVPLWYRLRLWRLHLIHRRRLARVCDVLFVGSGTLAARNVLAHPRLLTPVADDRDTAASDSQVTGLRAVFHSTSVHAAEHRWLRPIIGELLEAEASISFEVNVAPPLSFRWRGLPRTTILPSVPWPRYCAESRARRADLLLAPLLPSAANAARSWTKRIDAARLGAALLVSDAEVYQSSPEELRLGMHVPAEPAAWIAAIRDLAHDRNRLVRLRDLNRAYVMAKSATLGPSLGELL
jgi:hypothetical protein